MGGPQQNPSQLLLGGRVDMIMSSALRRAELRQGEPAVPLHRGDLPEGSAGADLPPRTGQRHARRPQGQADPDRRRRAHQLLAVPRGQVRIHRRADPPLHLQHGAVPRGQEHRRSRASCQPSPTRSRRPASIRWSMLDRRRRLRQLQHDHHISQKMVEEKKDLVQRFVNASPRGLGRIHEGRACHRSRPTP